MFMLRSLSDAALIGLTALMERSLKVKLRVWQWIDSAKCVCVCVCCFWIVHRKSSCWWFWTSRHIIMLWRSYLSSLQLCSEDKITLLIDFMILKNTNYWLIKYLINNLTNWVNDFILQGSNVVEDQDLLEIGILNSAHRQRLLQAIRLLPRVSILISDHAKV